VLTWPLRGLSYGPPVELVAFDVAFAVVAAVTAGVVWWEGPRNDADEWLRRREKQSRARVGQWSPLDSWPKTSRRATAVASSACVGLAAWCLIAAVVVFVQIPT